MNPQKQLLTRLIAVLSAIFIVSSFTAVDAGVWTDDFGDGVLNGWTDPSVGFAIDWESKWKIDRGILGFTIAWKPHVFKRPIAMADVLLLTAFPISAERLEVRVTLIDQWDGEVGLALGKPVPSVIPALPRVGQFYIFGKNMIRHLSAGAHGGVSNIAGKGPSGFYKEAPIGDVKVIDSKSTDFAGDDRSIYNCK